MELFYGWRLPATHEKPPRIPSNHNRICGLKRTPQNHVRIPHPIVLEWVREEGGGNVYNWSEKDMEGWLCPALFKYFDQTPEKLYIQVKAAEGQC